MNILFQKKITGCDSGVIRNVISEMMNSITSWNDLSPEDEYEIKLILNELIANSTVHGNKMLCNKAITALIEGCGHEKVYITIQDEGAGFNYHEIFNKGIYPCDQSLYSERGRGLKLIKSLCDDIAFNKTGNQIRICKSIRQGSFI